MATDPIRDKEQLKELADYWLERGNVRNYTLIVLGVCTALRIGDLLRITWDDVFDEDREKFRTHISVIEQKTGKQRIIALNLKALQALDLLILERRGIYLFASNRKDRKAISRVQAWRIIKASANAVKASGCIACHSLRKALGYHAWQNGVSPVVIMDIYGHTSYEITKRYLGVSQDDLDKVYLDTTLF